MFKRILVPLDGSTRAESAVPIAARIARASGGSVILLQVAAIPINLKPKRNRQRSIHRRPLTKV